jgi:hypothetical protein
MHLTWRLESLQACMRVSERSRDAWRTALKM